VCSTLPRSSETDPFYPAREDFRTGRPRAWTTQSNPRTLFPHRSSRLDDDAPPAHSTWTPSTRIPSALSTSEAENRFGRRRIPEFVQEELEGEPWVLTRWPVDTEASGRGMTAQLNGMIMGGCLTEIARGNETRNYVTEPLLGSTNQHPSFAFPRPPLLQLHTGMVVIMTPLTCPHRPRAWLTTCWKGAQTLPQARRTEFPQFRAAKREKGEEITRQIC
jgi:hypothetical protein